MEIKTDKQAFDYVVSQLINQNEKCLDVYGDCAYRGVSRNLFKQITGLEKHEIDEDLIPYIDHTKADLRCAVGHLINNDVYDMALEGRNMSDDLVKSSVKQSHPDWVMDEKSFEMMEYMQHIHDSETESRWEDLFKELFRFDSEGKFTNYGKIR